MADKLESIKHAWHQLQTSRDGSYAERVLPAALGEEVGYLLSRLEAAEAYIEATLIDQLAQYNGNHELLGDQRWEAASQAKKCREAWLAAKESSA